MPGFPFFFPPLPADPPVLTDAQADAGISRTANSSAFCDEAGQCTVVVISPFFFLLLFFLGLEGGGVGMTHLPF